MFYLAGPEIRECHGFSCFLANNLVGLRQAVARFQLIRMRSVVQVHLGPPGQTERLRARPSVPRSQTDAWSAASLAGLAWPDSGRAGPCWRPLPAVSRPVGLAIHVTGVVSSQAGMGLAAGMLARAISYGVASLSPGCWPGDTKYDDAGQWGRGQTGSAVQMRPGLDLVAAHDFCAGLPARVPRGRFRVPGRW
jgi:hypothetical protein